MITAGGLEALASLLNSAKSFPEVFGTLPLGAPAEERVRALKKSWTTLVKLTFPDHAPDDLKGRASEIFLKLQAFHESAVEAIAAGSYGIIFSKGAPPPPTSAKKRTTLQSRAATYLLDAAPGMLGEFSRLYAGDTIACHIPGASLHPNSPRRFRMKIALEPRFNQILGDELLFLLSVRNTPLGLALAEYLPWPIDTFMVSGGKGRLFRATVYAEAREDYLSVTEILRAFKNRVPPVHAGWIARRVLATALAARTLGVVHGAITPDHVLVHPLTRDPMHIGWSHMASRKREAIEKWRALYPPEFFFGQPLDSLADVFMCGKVIALLFAGEPLPSKLSACISAMTRTNRSERLDPGNAFDSLTDAIYSHWGRVYQELKLPED